MSLIRRPLIQNKLSVLSQAGLAKDDFCSAENSVLTAKVSGGGGDGGLYPCLYV